MRKTHLAALLLSLVLPSSGALAAVPSDQTWIDFSKSAIEQHVIPGYDLLSEQAKALAQSSEAYCATPSEQTLAQAREDFKQTLQAWQGISHVQFGPVTLLMRNFSMQYWPDKKNLGGRQLKSTIQSESRAYDDDFFAAASVAIKGLPAIEKLLFPASASTDMRTQSNFCPLLMAVTSHVASNSRAIAQEWRAEAASFVEFGEDLAYESASEAATELLKALVEPVEAISDAKLASPMGSSLAKLRWRKSEAWRSEQSIESVRSNIASLHHLYSGLTDNTLRELLSAAGEKKLAGAIDAKFVELKALLEAVQEPVNMQYDAAQYQALLAIQDKLKRLSDDLLAAMKPLGIQLGFNRRDGD